MTALKHFFLALAACFSPSGWLLPARYGFYVFSVLVFVSVPTSMIVVKPKKRAVFHGVFVAVLQALLLYFYMVCNIVLNADM